FANHLKLVEAIKGFGDKRLEETVPGRTLQFLPSLPKYDPARDLSRRPNRTAEKDIMIPITCDHRITRITRSSEQSSQVANQSLMPALTHASSQENGSNGIIQNSAGGSIHRQERCAGNAVGFSHFIGSGHINPAAEDRL